MAVKKYLELIDGVPTVVTTVEAGGAPNANRIPNLDANGQLAQTMLPAGIGVDATSIVASEALAAGDFVNIYNNAGAANVRKADASSNKPAHGYVLAAFASGATATVYYDDLNGQVTGATAGDVFLSATTPGKTVSAAPSASGQIVQRVGVAVSATAIHVKLDQFYAIS